VRLEFENPGYFLKPGMFVSAQIQAELESSAVLIPDSAVLQSGAKNTVFVAQDDGHFMARDVVLGVEGENDFYQVISGLSAGERVVTSGQFLLDSESQLREAIEKMKGGESLNHEMVKTKTNSTIQPFNKSTSPEPTVYVCPMPEHVSIIYDHAGNCPICGMTLVAVTPSALQKIQPGGKVLYYTCPMPEDSDIHEDKPGKCPRCGMTLIPVMGQTETKTKQLYTCPMHPEIISDKPGVCPKCGMDLVPVKNDK
jgi:rubrerythrin